MEPQRVHMPLAPLQKAMGRAQRSGSVIIEPPQGSRERAIDDGVPTSAYANMQSAPAVHARSAPCHPTFGKDCPQSMNAAVPKRMNVFERFLSLWVALCMAAGVVLGKLLPGAVHALQGMELGRGSQINVPIAVLIWLMIYPMMLKIDFGSIGSVGRKPKGLLITVVVNWLVKPFSMAFFGWLFFRHLFLPLIGAELAGQYIAGVIILAAAPCTAMVFVWSYLSDGDAAYTLVQVSVKDLIMLVALAPLLKFLISPPARLS